MIRKGFLLTTLIMFSFSALASEQQKLNDLLERIWQHGLSVSPVFATSLGIHDSDRELSDLSPEALAEEDRRYRSFLLQSKQLDSTKLDRTSQINLLVQQYNLQNKIDSYRFNKHYVPITSEYGFHASIANLPNSIKFRSLSDFENYLLRLKQVPRLFSQNIYWMKKGLSEGIVQPKVVLRGFEASVKAYFEKEIEKSSFYKPFLALDKVAATDAERQALVQQAKAIIGKEVYAAYSSFYDFLVDEYLPNAKENISVLSWPDGEAYYQNQIRYYTTTDLSAEEIHSIGLAEVARIRSEMQTIIDNLKFEGDINEFIHFLRTDPQFYAKSAEELLKHAAYYAKKMDAKLPQLFKTLPRTPYGVEPVPDSIAPKYTTGRYLSPSRDDKAGTYWVNTYALDKRPLYAIPALTLHEAVPGHHLQISLAKEMQSLPPVRRYTYFSAFGEGWGLYSEFLGKEVGIYSDPYNDFGRLSYEMWRACRLVVDTGMHVKGWSRQKALDYMLENTALSEHNITTEIDRYISWPAQALSYKIGEIEIKNLRLEAEKALGERFDLRAFHDAILEHGSVPLSVLRENIAQFIRAHSPD